MFFIIYAKMLELAPQTTYNMWIISTILDGGNLEDAINKAIAINAKRPSYLPPEGFLLSVLARISSPEPELPGIVDVTVLESNYIA